MLEITKGNKSAIIVLHEIYGINRHIEEVCQKYSDMGFDMYCPNLLKIEKPYDYSQQDEAYNYFVRYIGFDVYQEVNALAQRLKPYYRKIILLGFSIGATIAWRCAEEGFYDAIICCYGSRIRDYMEITPKCPTLLIFAKNEKSFSAFEYAELLSNKANTKVEVLDASHGFCDPFCPDYNVEAACAANLLIKDFAESNIKDKEK